MSIIIQAWFDEDLIPGSVSVGTSVGTIAFAGLAPTTIRTTGVIRNPGVGAIVVTGRQPTVVKFYFRAPGVGAITFAGLAPTVVKHYFRAPGVGSIVLTGRTPVAVRTQNIFRTPSVGAIAVSGLAPTVQVSSFPVMREVKDDFTGSSTSTHIYDLPADIVPGDLLIAMIAIVTATPTIVSIVDSTGDNWSTLSNQTTTGLRTLILYKRADGDEDSGTLTITTSANATTVSRIVSIRNWDRSEPPTTVSVSGLSDTFNPFVLTPSAGLGDYMWLPWYGVNIVSGQITFPTGYVDQGQANNISTASLGSAYKVSRATSEDPANFAIGASANYRVYTIAIQGLRTTKILTEISPPAGAITITGHAPTLARTAHQIIVPPKGNIVVEGLPPTHFPYFVIDGENSIVGSSVTLILPTHRVNDVFVAGVLVDGSTSAITTSTPGWQLIADVDEVVSIAYFWKRAASTAETNPVFTGTGNAIYASVGVWRGAVRSGTPFEDATFNRSATTQTTTILSSVIDTTNKTRTVVIHHVQQDNTSLVGHPPAGYIARAQVSDLTGNDFLYSIITKDQATAATIPQVTVGTLGVAEWWGTLTFALIADYVQEVAVPAAGAITFLGRAPTVASSQGAAQPGVGAISITGRAPTAVRTANHVRVPGVGAITLVGRTPTNFIQMYRVPGVGAIALAGRTPVAAVAANKTSIPGVGAIALAGLAPTAVRTQNVFRTPGVGAIALTGRAPANAVNFFRTPNVGAITITGRAPTVAVQAGQTVSPNVGAITLTGRAPTAVRTQNVFRTPGVGAVVLTGRAPTNAVNFFRTPGVGAITLTGRAPVVNTNGSRTATPSVGAIALTGRAPTAVRTANHTRIPGVGAIAVTGLAPVAVRTANVFRTPGVGAIALAGRAPVAVRTANVFRTPDVGNITLTGRLPTLARTFNHLRVPGVGTIVVTGQPPSTGKAAQTGVGTIAITGRAPVAVRTNGTFRTPGVGAITITGRAPIKIATSKVIITGVNNIALAGIQPFKLVSDLRTASPGKADISFIGRAPFAIRGTVRTPNVGAIAITGRQPTAARTQNHFANPSAGNISVSGKQPTAVRTANHRITTGAGAIALTGRVPFAQIPSATTEEIAGVWQVDGRGTVWYQEDRGTMWAVLPRGASWYNKLRGTSWALLPRLDKWDL